MSYCDKYTISASEEDIHEAFTITFVDYPDRLFANSEVEAHELAIDFLWSKLNV